MLCRENSLTRHGCTNILGVLRLLLRRVASSEFAQDDKVERWLVLPEAVVLSDIEEYSPGLKPNSRALYAALKGRSSTKEPSSLRSR